ncbi:MAG: S53 family peptidase [Halobacteriales archaeon]|nr:S53 family peptidase [Halobacteriales archaeon]
MFPRVFLVGLAMVTVLALPALSVGPLEAAQVVKPGSRSPLVAGMGVADAGLAPADFPVQITVGLDLHSKPALDAFILAASDPASPLFQHWLTQPAFNALYGPSPQQEQRVVQWLTDAGFAVTDTFANRLLVGAEGTAADVQRAFHVDLHLVQMDGATKYAILDEPMFPADIAAFTTGVVGLDNLVEATPRANLGNNCCSFAPADISTFYNDGGVTQTGSGQTIVVVGAYAWKDTDNTAFENQWGLPAFPAGSAQVCTKAGGHPAGCSFSRQNSIEVALDVEMAHGIAPAAVIKNYMAGTTQWTDFQAAYNKAVTDNPGHSVSTSWGSCEPALTNALMDGNDNIFSNGNAVGQSWFAASGDGGSDDCGNGGTAVDHPANSPHMMAVGGTHATCSSGMTANSPACGGYGSESAWSGSGGGASAHFAKPAFQTGCSVPADGKRDVPDIALEADTSPGNYIAEAGSWWIVGGTSDAAPSWAGYFAELNQKKGGTGLGLPGGRLYALCGGSSYHDITTGSNGAFSAASGYDKVTGLGTINAANLLANY